MPDETIGCITRPLRSFVYFVPMASIQNVYIHQSFEANKKPTSNLRFFALFTFLCY